MEYKKIMSSFLIFFVFISGAFASELPSENLDFWSSIKYGFSNGGLTIQGQEQACSVYPDDVRKSLIFSSTKAKNLKELSLYISKLNDHGKVNIYAINSDGSWKFLKEKEYDDRYTFASNTKYALEFYNCPKPQKKQSIYDYETSDGFKHGDLLCKGDYVAELNFDIEGKVSYNKILDCDKGCLGGVCQDEGEDKQEKQQVITHNDDGSEAYVWSDKKVQEEYKVIEQQLEGQNTELEKLQQTLEQQRADAIAQGDVDKAQQLQDEIDLTNKQIESTNKEKQNLAGDTNYLLYLIGGAGALFGARKLGVF